MKLFQWERGQVLDDDVLKVIDSAPAFAGGGYMTLRHAAEASGLGLDRLLRAALAGNITLYLRFAAGAYRVQVQCEYLDLNDPEHGKAGGYVVPTRAIMPL